MTFAEKLQARIFNECDVLMSINEVESELLFLEKNSVSPPVIFTNDNDWMSGKTDLSEVADMYSRYVKMPRIGQRFKMTLETKKRFFDTVSSMRIKNMDDKKRKLKGVSDYNWAYLDACTDKHWASQGVETL
jgi:hypothetical protein